MGVFLGGVCDFEDAVIGGVGVVARGRGYCGFAHFVEVAIWVCGWVDGDGVRFFVGYCVCVAVDGGVDTYIA